MILMLLSKIPGEKVYPIAGLTTIGVNYLGDPDARASGIPALRHFAEGLQQDDAAVRAALCSELSNGQTEGQVNRLKVIKRIMYGRANFDLLRLRVLHPP